VQPLLKEDGEKAYRELLEHTYSVLNPEDVRRLKEWSDFYFVSEYGYPQIRGHFYHSLQEVFEAQGKYSLFCPVCGLLCQCEPFIHLRVWA
jgi:hypothetical protein